MKLRERFSDPSIIQKINEIENSPENKKKIDDIKKSLKNKMSKNFQLGIRCLALSLIACRILKEYAFILVVFIWVYFYNNYSKNKGDITDSYISNFLEPVLEEVLPDTKIDYFGDMDLDVLSSVVQASNIYYSNCHITFGDEYKTEFCNMHATHYERNEEKKLEEVENYRGQVLVAHLETGISGHIRVVPVSKKLSSGRKLHKPYGEKRDEEKEIETESIDFNEKYSIFSTDDFYTKLILDAYLIDFLNKIRDRRKVSIYMNEKYIAISFRSKSELFSLPIIQNDIDRLSLSGEYEQLRNKLVDFYELTDIILKNF